MNSQNDNGRAVSFDAPTTSLENTINSALSSSSSRNLQEDTEINHIDTQNNAQKNASSHSIADGSAKNRHDNALIIDTPLVYSVDDNSSTVETTNSKDLKNTETKYHDVDHFPLLQKTALLTHLQALGFKNGDTVYIRAIAGKGYELQPQVRKLPFKLPHIKWKTLENLQFNGYGLYLVVNGGGDRDKDVTCGRAFFCEFDDRPIDEQITFWKQLNVPEPSLQIKTRKSVHSYWILDSSCSVKEWKSSQTLLLNTTESDKSLKNPSRVMRLAGSWHVKNGCDPVFCEIIHEGGKYQLETITNPLKTAQEIRKKEPAPRRPIQPVKTSSPDNNLQGRDVLIYCLTKRNQEVLERGVSEGGRNNEGAILARNLIGTSNYLLSMNERFDNDPRTLFEQFCDKCSPPLDPQEREVIWKSAVNSNPTPTLDSESLKKRIEYFRRATSGDYNSSYYQKTSKLKEVPVSESSNDPPIDDPRINPNTGAKLSFNQLALKVLYGFGNYICLNGELYAWNNNFYLHTPDTIEYKRIKAFCDEYTEEIKGELVHPYAKPSKVKEVLEYAKMEFATHQELVNPPGVNCTNGVVEITWDGTTPHTTFVPHDPLKHIYLDKPQVAYNPIADPKECQRLLECLDASQREILLRVLAASIDVEKVRSIRGRDVKALLLKGLGANGKDALRNVVANIYGDNALTSVSLADFANYDQGRKFSLSALINSRVNWASENPNTGRLDNIQSLKLFVTGNRLHSEKKGKDHVEFTPKAVGLFNVNDVPALRGVIQAITDRLAVLTFRKTYKKNPDPQNPNEMLADPRFAYDQTFVREMVAPAFLNMMLASLQKLVTEGIDYEPVNNALEEIQRENCHLFGFAEDTGLTYEQGSHLTVDDIWNKLLPWYLENGTCELSHRNEREVYTWNDQARPSDKNVKSKNQVIARFLQIFPKATRATMPHPSSKKQIPVLQGLAFKERSASETDNTTQVATLSTTPNAPQSYSVETCSLQASHPSYPHFQECARNFSVVEEPVYYAPVVLDDYQKSQTVDSTGNETTAKIGVTGVAILPGTGFSDSVGGATGVVTGVEEFSPANNAAYIRIALEENDWEMVTTLTEIWQPNQKKQVWAHLTEAEKKALIALKRSYDAQNNQQNEKTGSVNQDELQVEKTYQVKVVRTGEWVNAETP